MRRAVAGVLPGYAGLRVQRDPLHLVIHKGGAPLFIDQLSDGEKQLLALAADLARRLAITYPTSDDPLAGEGVVLIDEIELTCILPGSGVSSAPCEPSFRTASSSSPPIPRKY